MTLDSPVVTGANEISGYDQTVPATTTPRLCWSAVGIALATGLIVAGAVWSVPWVFVPAVILLAYTGGPLLAWARSEHRIRAEAARGFNLIDDWLRTAPALSAASTGATRECCPICGAPVDPRSARCRRHGSSTL